MPPRRERIEALLSAGERDMIAEQCGTINVPFALWLHCPQLPRYWLLVCIDRLAARFVKNGMSQSRAQDLAAEQLGISPDTVKSWRFRGRRAAYKGAKCTQLDPPADCTIAA